MKDFDAYFEKIFDKTEVCQLPKATENTFFVNCSLESDSQKKVVAKNQGPHDLCIINLSIDDYETIVENELIAESADKITLTDKIGKWSITFTGQKLYFYKSTDENVASAYILKIIE